MKERPKEIMTITLIGINILVFIVLTMIGRTEDGYFMLQHGAMYEQKIRNTIGCLPVFFCILESHIY